MSDEPLVSVVMIFLNAGRYIEEAIVSVFAQEYPRWELLLVDDGSSDEGTAIARRYAEAHPDRVRYLEHPGHVNRGMSASRNLGIASSRGSLIALLDADDAWLPVKLARQVAILNDHPDAGMVYDATKYWYTWQGGPGLGDGREERLRRLGFPAGTLVRSPDLVPLFLRGEAETPGTCSVLMRKTAIDRVGGFVDSFRGMYEDQAFFFKMCLEFPAYLDEGYTALYRQHEASACAVAASNGLYALAGRPNPSEEAFLDWLAAHVTEQCGEQKAGANRLPGPLKARLLRRHRRSGRSGTSGRLARLLWKIDPIGRASGAARRLFAGLHRR